MTEHRETSERDPFYDLKPHQARKLHHERPLPSDLVDWDGRCPACAKAAIYSWETDRFFHADGSDNTYCWYAAAQELSVRLSAEFETMVREYVAKNAKSGRGWWRV